MIERCDCCHQKQRDLHFPKRPFSALVFCDECMDRNQMDIFCDKLIKEGCMYFAAAGKFHQGWYNAFDESKLRFDPELMDKKLITTVSYEQIDTEVLDDWLLISDHPCAEIKTGLILYENDEQQLMLWKKLGSKSRIIWNIWLCCDVVVTNRYSQ